MKVLVTGATGFIGTNLCQLLVEQGHEVVALIRPGSDTFKLSQLQNVKFSYGDILNHDSLNRITPFPELVIHLAVDWSRLNAEDDKLFFEFLVAKKIRRLIFYSSVCASGLDLSTQPLSEKNTPMFLSTDYYGRYKYDVENIINQKTEEGCFEGINLRPTIVYGPGDISNLYPLFKAVRNRNLALWDNGNQKIRPCFVYNLNQTTIELAKNNVMGLPVSLHVGDKELLTVYEIVEIIANTLNFKLKYINHHKFLAEKMAYIRFALNRFKLSDSFGTHFAFKKWTREYNANIEILDQQVGTKHMISFKEAIHTTVNWYKINNFI